MERFKRGDESRNTEGSGLGLSIAKDLTALMNGVFEISIDGDLFKASVILDDAVTTRQIRSVKSPVQADSEAQISSAVQGVCEAAEHAAGNAGQAVGETISRIKEKIKERIS